ncbi:arylsulfatase B-like isoform X2 [Anneissia japonica]|uniref:arylsulfatase B-like isoform X2 n=1 Tax=Anneissia japonica TaxID=1529436 RepID=UPI0014256A1B|nr:arylsulfatase B-like isoform X2 [Anneissia japonica]
MPANMATSMLLLGLIVIICTSVSLTYATSSQPNVIFIMGDDQGYRDIGYHGSLFKTPIMDKLAEEGVKLENYYVQFFCTPTRAQLMTGRYQIRMGLQNGVLDQDQKACLPLDEVTLAEKMQEAGYSTHLIGKWHLGLYREGCLPNNRGFDTFFGFLQGAEYFFSHDTPKGQLDFYRDFEPQWQYNGSYATHLYTDEAIDLINNKDPDKPMFMWLSHQAPHAPLEVPQQYSEPYRDIIEDDNRRTYAGMMACMDEGIGNVTEALKANGIYDNTIIIYTTDNGGPVWNSAYNWPLRAFKGSLFEGGIRGVGFVHSPLLSDKVKGTVSYELIHVSDWLPTLVEGIAGWTTEGTLPLDGINQWETIRDGRSSNRIELLHNIDPLEVLTEGGESWSNSPFDVRIKAAIRLGNYKLLTGDNGEAGWYAPPGAGLETEQGDVGDIVRLYNIKRDPEERNNLASKYRILVRCMLKKLARYYEESVEPFDGPNFPEEADPCKNGNNCVWGPWATDE